MTAFVFKHVKDAFGRVFLSGRQNRHIYEVASSKYVHKLPDNLVMLRIANDRGSRIFTSLSRKDALEFGQALIDEANGDCPSED